MKTLLVSWAAVAMLFAVPAVADIGSININGAITGAETSGATIYTIGNGGGTAYLFADQNYAYGLFDITGWTAAMGAASHGNLLGFGVQKGTGNYPAGTWIEFQEATDPNSWGGGGPSGTIDGKVAAFRLNTAIQGSLPGDLQAASSFATGHLVWEVQMPLSLMGGLNVGDTLNVVGGINYDGDQHWYPAAFGANPYASYTEANYGHLTVEGPAAVPEPTSIVLLATMLFGVGVARRRSLAKR